MNGTFEIYYYGPFGHGQATMNVANGVVSGVGVAGVTFTGTLLWDQEFGVFKVKLLQFIPGNGVTLVTDGRARFSSESYDLQFDLPPDFEGRQLPLQLPHGLATVVIRRLEVAAA